MIKEGINCLNNFKNFEDIKNKYKKISNRNISDISYEERINKLTNSSLFKELTSNIPSNNKYSLAEILSWIDSLNLIYRIFSNAKINSEIKRDARIIQEYSIPYTRNNRTDFLIIKDNKILILEFTFKNSKYLDKAQQCFTYKQILNQFLPNNIEVISYVFSYGSETKEDHEIIEKQIETCVKFLNFFFNSGKAYEELEKIENLYE